jgi:divalent metal cation (Fe/Co/Zn/Cd) transporter
MIAKQGVQMFLSSLFELLDASSDPTLPSKLKPLLESNESSLKAVKSIKSFKSGPLSRVEIEATVDSTLSVVQLIDLEQRLLKLVKEFTHDEVSEVILRPR